MPFRLGRPDRRDPDSDVRRFAAAFPPDAEAATSRRPWGPAETEALFRTANPRYTDFIARSAVASYGKGILRVLLPGGVPDLVTVNGANGWTSEWPGLTGLAPFAYDWLGRLHMVDTRGSWIKAGSVVRFSPGTGDVEAATPKPCGLDEYLMDLLPRNARDWLSADYFDDWLAAGGRPLGPTECAAYIVPLTLGGEDDVPNLAVSDVEVYLSLAAQIHRQTADMPDGARIDGVSFQ